LNISIGNRPSEEPSLDAQLWVLSMLDNFLKESRRMFVLQYNITGGYD
jgi:hypothetical protein